MVASKPKTVTSRLVLNFPGFEATAPSHQLERLSANGDKFGKVWHEEFSEIDKAEEPENHLAVSNFQTKGKNW